MPNDPKKSAYDAIPPEIMALLDPMQKGGEAMLLAPLLADYLREARSNENTPMPAMRSYGNVTRAANPMEFAAAALRQMRGREEAARLEAEQRAGVGAEAAGAGAGLKALWARQYAPQEAAPAPQEQPWSPGGLIPPFAPGPGTPVPGPARRPRPAAAPPGAAPGAAPAQPNGPVDMDPDLYRLIYGG